MVGSGLGLSFDRPNKDSNTLSKFLGGSDVGLYPLGLLVSQALFSLVPYPEKTSLDYLDLDIHVDIDCPSRFQILTLQTLFRIGLQFQQAYLEFGWDMVSSFLLG